MKYEEFLEQKKIEDSSNGFEAELPINAMLKLKSANGIFPNSSYPTELPLKKNFEP